MASNYDGTIGITQRENAATLADATDDEGQSGAAESAATVESREGQPTTDVGNARRFASALKGRLKYCAKMKAWFEYGNGCWRPDTMLRHQQLAKKVVTDILLEAHAERDDAKRAALMQWARVSQSVNRIAAMLTLARDEPDIALDADLLDDYPWLLNVANGVVDLRTGGLLPHSPDYLFTKQVATNYDPDAPCAAWDGFLGDIMGGDGEMISFLKRVVGSTLAGQPSDRIMLMLYGTGTNGKSTFLETLLALFGDYGKATPMETLMEKRSGAISSDVAALKGTRFVAASEGQEGARLDSALVKRLTGNDTISARFMYADYFSFKPTFIIFVATNHKPLITDSTDSIWKRVKLIPFSVQFRPQPSGPERAVDDRSTPYVDTEMPHKLLKELPGILRWAVDGCLEWQMDGLGEPKAVAAATAQYRGEMDVVASWLDECCEADHPGATVPFRDLLDSYTRWCEENGEHPINGRRFAQRLDERGIFKAVGTNNVKLRKGIRFNRDEVVQAIGGRNLRSIA